MEGQSAFTPIIDSVIMFAILLVAILLLIAGLAGLGYFLFLWYKHRHRENQSLEFVLLQVAVPKDNEVKIDAAEHFLPHYP